MSTAFLSPILNDCQFSDDGLFLVGGLIWFYEAGTTTPAIAYTGPDESTAWSNPIVLNARGEAGGEIWLDSATAYKIILEAPPLNGDTHGVVISTFDNITGVYVAPEPTVSANWVQYTASNPVYLTSTSFSLAGDQTLIFQYNRRVRAITSGGPTAPVFCTVKDAVFASGVTTITVLCDSGSLDTGLTTVYYGFVETSPSSIPNAVLTGSASSATTDEIYITTSGGKLSQSVNSASTSTNWPIDVTGDLTGNVTGNVTGNLTGNVTGNVTGNLTGMVSLSNGSAAAPSLNLASSTTTGFYRFGADVLGFSAAGVNVLTLSSIGYAGPDGSNTAPSISFLSSPGTGVYKTSTNGLGLSVSGTKIIDVKSTGLQITPGSSSNPSVSFFSDTTTGAYSGGSGIVGFSSAGTHVGGFTSTGLASLGLVSATISNVATADDFIANFGTTGSQVIAGNLLIQWGTGTIAAAGVTVTVTTPIAGSSLYRAYVCQTGVPQAINLSSTVTGSAKFDVVGSSAVVAALNFNWFTIGKV